jgi:hypothetical protein
MTGYQSKKAAAQAKVEGPIHVVCQCDKCKAQPAQEPVATVQCIHGITIGYLEIMQPVGTKLYTTPPQRPWVGLTDEEIDDIDEANWEEDHKVWGIHEFARAVEAKLKEKNT